MPDLFILTLIFSFAIFLFAVAIGSNLFAVMVDEQLQYLRLIALYAPLRVPSIGRSLPVPVSEYLVWAAGNTKNPAGCAGIRFSGRTRLGKNGRWMKTGGRAWFSLSVPNDIWHTTLAFIPGIWIETCDYHVHRTAGTNFNLFSFFPLNNAHSADMIAPSLFRYLAAAPFFPHVLASPDMVSWEKIDDSAATATLHHGDRSVRALVRFDGNFRIGSIVLHDTAFPVHENPFPGVFSSTYYDYANIRGHQIPRHIVFEAHLADGEYICTEYWLNDIGYSFPMPGSEVVP